MADKMMRMAGRAEDGKAKAIKTDKNGVIETYPNDYRALLQQGTPTTVAAGATWESGYLKVENVNKLIINTYLDVSALNRVTVKEYIQSDLSTKEIGSYSVRNSANAVTLNGNNKLETLISDSANVIKITVQNASTAPFNLQLFAYGTKGDILSYFDTADNTFKPQKQIATEASLQQLVANSSDYKVVLQQGTATSVSAGATWGSAYLKVENINKLVINTYFDVSALNRVTVKEYVQSDLSTKEIGSYSVRNSGNAVTLYGNNKLETPISDSANLIKIFVQNASTAPFNVQLFVYGTKGDMLTYFDTADNSFKKQTQIATETTLQQLVNILNTRPAVPKELPNKPELKNIKLLKGTGDQILWYANGLFYANDRSNRNRVVTSPDAENWTLLHEFSVPISKILVGDTGCIMAGGVFGEVFISDENGVFQSTPNFVTGKLSHMFGRFKHENVLGFSTYHSPAGMGDGQLHEAFLSTDNGKTYNKVFDNAKLATLLQSGGTYADPRIHLHDFEYDPYSGRLYIWQGDFDSVTFYYSDDWGANWSIGFPRGVADNHSQIIATKEGITFGADNPTGGVGLLKLDRSSTMPEIDIANFDKNHWNFKISEGENYVAAGKFVDRKNDLYLLAFEVEHDKNSVRSGVLAYSRDGIDWQILFQSPIKGGHTGFETVFYGNGKLVALYKDNSKPLIYNTMIADMEI